MSHDLVEPSHAVISCLANLLYESQPHWIKHKAQDAGMAKYGSDPGVDEDVRFRIYENAILYLYDALIDWMGPGGDAFFLDMYIMANGDRLPLTIEDVREWSSGVGETYTDSCNVRHLATDHNKTMEEKARWLPIVNRPETHFDVFLPRTELLYSSGKYLSMVAFVVRPKATYREDMMGELATPWPELDDGFRFMRPRRHVLPLDRPYDESGYIP